MSKTTKAISAVTILLIISRLFGFIREMVIAAYYGASYQTDAYNMALVISGLFTTFFSATVATVIIPMYNHKLIKQSQPQADSFMNNLLWTTSLLNVFLSIMGIILASVLVRIFAPNFDVNTNRLTVNMLRLMFIFTVTINVSNFMASIFQIYNKFAITIIASFPVNIFTLFAVIFLADKIGIYALVTGYILFLITQMLILILSVHKVFSFQPVLNLKNDELKYVLKLSFPVYISVAVWEINMIIDKILASGLPEGSISAMMYATRLRSLPDGIITTSVLTVAFPLLAKYAAKKEFANLKAVANKAISLLFMALLPVIAVSIYYAKDITKIVYERGAFMPNQTVLIANIFTFSVVSLIFSGGASLFTNAFYSIQDTKSPQIAAVIMIVFNIMFNFVLIRYMQAAGLALATSIASFVHFLMLFIQFRSKFGAFGGLSLLKNSIKCAIATSGMIPIFFICEVLRTKLPLLIFFAVTVTFSLCVYALVLYLLKVKLFVEAWEQVKTSVSKKLNI